MGEFEKTFQQLTDSLMKEREKLERRIATGQEQLGVVALTLRGLDAALLYYREKQGIEIEQRIELDEKLRERFRDMTHKDAMVALAIDNDGVIAGKDACKTLVAAGVFRNQRDAQNSFYRTTSRFPEVFQKVQRGVYRISTEALKSAAGDQWADTLPPQPIIQRTA